MESKTNATPTPYKELNTVLRVLVDNVRDILQANFVGAYLQGSCAVGDFDIHTEDSQVLNSQALSGQRLIYPFWSSLIDRAWDGRPNPAFSVRQPADPKDLRIR